MTQISRPFTGTTIGDAGPYSASQWARTWRTIFSTLDNNNAAVIFGTGASGGSVDPLNVTETSPASDSVEINTGAAMVKGYWYESDAVETIQIPANTDASGDDRIDYIALELDTSDQEIRLIHIQGTPDPSPSPPSLTQNSTIWQVPIAEVLAQNTFSSIFNGDITYVADSFAVWDDRAGGTNQDAYSAGDILAANQTPRLTKISPTADGALLTRDSYRSAGSLYQQPTPIVIAKVIDQSSFTPASYADGAWRTIEITGAVNDPNSDVVAVSSNQFELEPGVYMLAHGNFGGGVNNTHRAAFRVRNVTQGTNEPDWWKAYVSTSELFNEFTVNWRHVFSVVSGDLLEWQIYPQGAALIDENNVTGLPEYNPGEIILHQLLLWKLAGGTI